MTQWEPIETAPKDGTWLLGYRGGYRYGKQKFFTFRYWPSDGKPPFWFSNMDGWPQPTYWTPLPEPPEEPK